MSSVLYFCASGWNRPMHAPSEVGGYPGSIRTTARFVAWTLAWLVTLAVARFGPVAIWDPQQSAASWAAIGVNLLVGIGWIVAFTRLLGAMDELQRKLMLEALAITLGVGWVGGFGLVVANAAGLLGRDAELALFPALLGVVFVAAFAVGRFRYR